MAHIPDAEGARFAQHDEHDEDFDMYGRWLASIAQADRKLLRQTREFRDFIGVIERLGVAHRHILFWNQNRRSVEEENFTDLRLQRSQPCLSFVQHLASDEILLRIFEFLESYSLLKTTRTCTRFHSLANESARLRTLLVAQERQLGNPIQLLRATEQIEGIDVSPGHAQVRVPTLLLSRRVEVTDSGDPEYNGIYHCTGSNGNGFVFTKPRHPEQRVARTHTEALRRLPDDLLEVAQPGQLLRCIIAKRFSNETILWYLSKEVIAQEDNGDAHAGDVVQIFSFWSNLMVIGDASPDICRYPSQTSILTRHNRTDGWQSLSTTRNVQPPILELLD